MEDVTIQYKLDLAVRLIDTTTGNPVTEKQVIFRTGGEILSLLERGETYILINRGRVNMELQVEVKGYLTETVIVDYEQLSKREPLIELPLIPELKPYGYDDLTSVEGTLEGIESIEAIQTNNPMAAIGNYIEPKQTLKLFKSKHLGERSYAILHNEDNSFEAFSIAKKVDKFVLKLKNPLEQKVVPEETVTRLIRGRAENNHYLLRIRDNGKGSEYIVRYVVNGEPTFVRIDLDDPEGRRLPGWESQ